MQYEPTLSPFASTSSILSTVNLLFFLLYMLIFLTTFVKGSLLALRFWYLKLGDEIGKNALKQDVKSLAIGITGVLVLIVIAQVANNSIFTSTWVQSTIHQFLN